MNMAARAFTFVVLAGSSFCLYHAAAIAQSSGPPPDSAFFNGLRLSPPEALTVPGPETGGRYDWLRLGMSPDRQTDSMLSLPGQGALGLSVDQFGRRASTGELLRDPRAATAMRLQAAYLLGETWGLASQYQAGSIASPMPSLQSISPLKESLGVSVFRTGNWLQGDRLSLTLSSPVRTGMSGMIDSGLSPQGDGLIGLRAAGREYSTELSYFTPLARDAGLGFALSQRQTGLHDYGVPDERMMSIRFSGRF